jgi:hypothetical protein
MTMGCSTIHSDIGTLPARRQQYHYHATVTVGACVVAAVACLCTVVYPSAGCCECTVDARLMNGY